MIRNDKQYKVTRFRLKGSLEALKDIEQQSMDPLWRELSEGAIRSQIEDFEKEIYEYERLKTGKVQYVTLTRLQDVNEALIKARICKRWTQADLAGRLNMKEQQIQRYESCNYGTASFERISEIATALEIEMHPTKLRICSPADEFPRVNPEIVANGFNKMKERGSLLF